ncbi:MAG: sporulation protein YqfD, partial [Lachnospiraceae bacterium]|nr:sporulation protein YqfD [Lachnospiraceae bacterium]
MRARRINRVRGYLLILIQGGSPERFLNICNVHQIEIWNLNHTPEGYECNISIADFKRLKPIVRKTRTRLMIRKRYGVPFFLYKYRHRKAFFIGIVSAFLAIYMLSLFVWDIHLVGNYSHTEQSLLDYLSEEQITHGMKISEVDCDRIEKLIRNKYDDIVW